MRKIIGILTITVTGNAIAFEVDGWYVAISKDAYFLTEPVDRYLNTIEPIFNSLLRSLDYSESDNTDLIKQWKTIALAFDKELIV